MPQNVRSRSNSTDSSMTELSSEGGELDVPAEVAVPAPTKASKRAPSTAKASGASKGSKDEPEATTKRRSNRVASQPAQVDDAPLATKKSASKKRTKRAEDTEVGELENKLKAVNLKVASKEPKPKPVHKHEGDYFNPLPILPEVETPHPQLFVWGAGNGGQFGMGPDNVGEFSRPQKNTLVEDMMKAGKFGEKGSGFVAVAAGGMASLLIDTNGTIWSCGVNDEAALGRSTEAEKAKKNAATIDEETLSTTLHPLQSLVDEGFRAAVVTAGDSIGAAISEAGDLRVWGTFRARDGVLGFSGGLQRQLLPIPVLDLKSKPGDVEKFVDVAAGNDHVVVVTTHGNIYTWGVGECGQLGRKVLERHKIHGTSPERIVIGSRANKAWFIGAGAYTSFAVDDLGNVWGWGANNCGQTGTGFVNGSTDREIHVPKKVIGLTTEELGVDNYVLKIAGGDDHTLFMTANGHVYACGVSIDGRLGLADDDPAFAERTFPDFLDRPALVTFPDSDDPIVNIAVGTRTSMAISRSGVLYMWGEGSQSELGAGKVEVLKVPTPVAPKAGRWQAVTGSCGGQHALALFRQMQ